MLSSDDDNEAKKAYTLLYFQNRSKVTVLMRDLPQIYEYNAVMRLSVLYVTEIRYVFKIWKTSVKTCLIK